MVQRIGGMRRKTRYKLRKNYREKGKLCIRRYMQNFAEGEKVCLDADSSLQKGMYPPKFHGKMGTVLKKKGRCYEVSIKDGGLFKCLIVHPAHLRKV